jgi:hypothetical protein
MKYVYVVTSVMRTQRHTYEIRLCSDKRNFVIFNYVFYSMCNVRTFCLKEIERAYYVRFGAFNAEVGEVWGSYGCEYQNYIRQIYGAV